MANILKNPLLLSTKNVAGMLVAAGKFNLKSSPSTQVLETYYPNKIGFSNLILENFQEPIFTVMHPLLTMAPITSDSQTESLPLIEKDTAKLIFPDSLDSNMHWHLPSFSYSDITKSDHPVLEVITSNSIDENGKNIFAGTFKLFFERTKIIHNNSDKVIPIKIDEASISLPYTDTLTQQKKQITITSSEIHDDGHIEFIFMGKALALFYHHIAKGKGVSFKIYGKYSAYLLPKKKSELAIRNQNIDKKFSFLIDDIFSIMGRGTIVVGKVLSGTIELEDTIFYNNTKESMITRIEIQRKTVKSVKEGDICGLLLRGVRTEELTSKSLMYGKKRSTSLLKKYIKTENIFSHHLQASRPCTELTNIFIYKNNNNKITFRCTPPWKTQGNIGNIYQKINTTSFKYVKEYKNIKIYESMIELGTYLIVPSEYILSMDIKKYSPAITMTSVLDPVNSKSSKVVFSAHISPNITAFQHTLIANDLENYLQKLSNNQKKAIKCQNLTEGNIGTPKLIWSNQFSTTDEPIKDSNGFLISFVADSLPFAFALTQNIKSNNTPSGLHANLNFTVDKTAIDIPVHIKMKNYIGNYVTIIKKPDQVIIKNILPLSISLKAYLRKRKPMEIKLSLENNSPLELKIFSSDILLNSGEEYSITGNNLDIVAIKASISDNRELSIEELRIDTGNIQQTLIFHTEYEEGALLLSETNPIEYIELQIFSDNISNSIHKIHKTQDNTFLSLKIDLNLPLNKFLEKESRKINYKFIIIFTDKSTIESDKLTHDFSESAFVKLLLPRTPK